MNTDTSCVETSVGNQIKSFIVTISLSGIHWIVDSHNWASRQLWLLLILAAITLSGYFSWSVSYSYLTETSFSVDYRIDHWNVSKDGLVPFPEFVLCLEAPWDIAKSKKENISIDLLSYMTNFIFPYAGFGSQNNYSKMPDLEKEYLNTLNKNGWNLIELLNKVTVSCENIIEFCYFGLSTKVNGIDCCYIFF